MRSFLLGLLKVKTQRHLRGLRVEYASNYVIHVSLCKVAVLVGLPVSESYKDCRAPLPDLFEVYGCLYWSIHLMIGGCLR